MWGHSKKKSNHLQVTFHQISITLETDLELPAFRTVRNKFLFCKLPNLWYFVMSGWAVYYICIREERKMWLEMQRRRKRRDAWWSSKVIEFSAQAFKKPLLILEKRVCGNWVWWHDPINRFMWHEVTRAITRMMAIEVKLSRNIRWQELPGLRDELNCC